MNAPSEGAPEPPGPKEPPKGFASAILARFARQKDGITGLIAATLFVVGAFQYLEYRADMRIASALDILKSRESSVFINARATLIRKSLDTEPLRKALRESDIYTDEFIADYTKEVLDDRTYQTAILHMSAFYHNAAACALDGVCDAPTVCASLMGEIQDYLYIHKGYFAFARSLRGEDAVSLYQSLPEFQNFCAARAWTLAFARHDRNAMCQTGLSLYRMTGFTGLSEAFCRPRETQYGQDIIDAAKKIKQTPGK